MDYTTSPLTQQPQLSTAQIEKYAGNGAFHISDDAFTDMAVAFVATEGAHALYAHAVLQRLQEMRKERPVAYRKAVTALRGVKMPDGSRPWWPDLERALDAIPQDNGGRPSLRPSEELMDKHFDPPEIYIEGFLTHGMTILAGKRKKGKSTLALEMALAIATGRKAFQGLKTKQSKVAYISLEDDEPLIQLRLRKIQEDFAGNANLLFLYKHFARLDEPQALQWLTEYVIEEGVKVIIIDVLGRVLPAGNDRVRGNTDDYQKFTELLGPLQHFANEHRVALLLLDHTRKADADDLFDAVHGSGAKTAVADTVMIFTRRFKENDAQIDMTSRGLGENTIRLTMDEGRLRFLGMGEEDELNREEFRIQKVLGEEGRPMALKDIMLAMGIPLGQYPRFRVAMHRMYHKGMVGKTARGMYTVGVVDNVPF